MKNGMTPQLEWLNAKRADYLSNIQSMEGWEDLTDTEELELAKLREKLADIEVKIRAERAKPLLNRFKRLNGR